MSMHSAISELPLARRPRGAPPVRTPGVAKPGVAKPGVAKPSGNRKRGADDDVDPRHATFREISELSLELYLAGDLGFPESAYFGRQPELHPAYARTVGRLTGVDADRAGPRDHLRLWEDRLDFAERYLLDDRPSLNRLRRIVGALRRLTARIDVASRSRGRLAG
ncbi:MAG: hypothetical protein MUE49_01100 [Rhodospirillales bacterium]|jgi:hypothetical protein|nr:hypothetical protein [Rhodospirillales bacterium]